MSSTHTLKERPVHTCTQFEICMIQVDSQSDANAIGNFFWSTFGLYPHDVIWHEREEALSLSGFCFKPVEKESVRAVCETRLGRKAMIQFKTVEMYTA